MIKELLRKIQVFYHRFFSKKHSILPANRFFFIHIPKTAGTSFRSSFERYSVTYKDYGNDKKLSSKHLNKSIYQEKNFYSFKKSFEEHDTAWITGHVKLIKYIDLVPITNTITFVRNPVERVISQFYHHIKHHRLDEGLSTFIESSLAKNGQSKLLGFMPLNLIGCVGITEFYNDSLLFINQQYALCLPQKSENKNIQSKLALDTLDETLKSIIIRNNQKDLQLYNEAVYLHQLRMELFKQNKPWTNGYAEVNAKNLLQGCAYQYSNEGVVTVVIKLNGGDYQTIVANEFYGLHTKANFPRDRYVGFQFPLPKSVTGDDVIDVYVKSTGQKLNFKPLTVKK